MLAPEQAAVFLRERGIAAMIRERSGGSWREPMSLRVCLLDGREVPLERFYAVVNEERAKLGQPPVAVPQQKEPAV
ncbi:hypothetical protein D3C83_249780 [compost metagenome]